MAKQPNQLERVIELATTAEHELSDLALIFFTLIARLTEGLDRDAPVMMDSRWLMNRADNFNAIRNDLAGKLLRIRLAAARQLELFN